MLRPARSYGTELDTRLLKTKDESQLLDLLFDTYHRKSTQIQRQPESLNGSKAPFCVAIHLYHLGVKL